MLDYNLSTIRHIALHQVGNPQGEGNNYLSDELLDLTDALHEDVKQYLLKPLKKLEEQYKFVHSAGVELNQIYQYAKAIFDRPDDLLPFSKRILQHLAQQSTHPQIKAGDVYVVYFPDIIFNDEVVNAIGIFKSERKTDFMRVEEGTRALSLLKLQGSNIDKLDKGCLIMNTHRIDGYRVLTFDNNQYDAMYWMHYFLGIEPVADEHLYTKQYLQMFNDFTTEHLSRKKNQKEQIQFLTDVVDYFDRNEEFDYKELEQELGIEGEAAKDLDDYCKNFGLDQVDRFPIVSLAVKNAKRKIKTLIKLDTNIKIKLDINDPGAGENFLERGYDEARGMFYYKVFFNDEI